MDYCNVIIIPLDSVSKDRVLWNIYIKLCILFSRRVYKVLLRLLGSEKNARVSELVKAVARGNDNMLLGRRKFEDIHFTTLFPCQ